MSKDKGKKNKGEFVRSSETELSAEITYTDEQQVQNAENITVVDDNISNGMRKFGSLKFSSGDEEEGTYKELELKDVKFNLKYADGYEFLEMFSIDNMKERITKGEKLGDICYDLKEFIFTNKDINPDLVQRAIAQLLEDSENYYDEGTDNLLGISGFTRAHQGDNSMEVLSKILDTPDGENLHGFVCSTISEFGMMLLEECGIPATMLCGGTDKTNHTTLLWQRSDGKFVQNNYGHSYTLNATNMKDAAREVYKKGLGLLNNGYIYFVDEHGSYQEFSLKEEAVWGHELDKRDYNRQSLFNNNVASQSSINGNVNFSNQGSISAEVSGTVAYHNEDNTVSKDTSFALGYKKSGVTSLADCSTSVGGKVEHRVERLTEKGKTFSDTKVIVDLTTLHTNESTVAYNMIQPITNRSFKDPEQLAQLRQWYSDEYETYNTLEYFNWQYDWCDNYIQHFDEKYQGAAPMTKEEFIQNQYRNYKDGDGVPYAELSDFGKKNADRQINTNWENYLINNRYDGALEIVQDRQSNYKDHIDNYDKYKEEYIEKQLDSYTNLDGYNKEEVPTTTTLKAFDTTHITAFIRKMFGKEKTLLKDDNMELTNAWQIGGLLGFNLTTTSTFSFGGDVRLQAEDGLKLDIGDKNTLSSTAISGGIVADMSLKSGTLTPAVSPGLKLNGSTLFKKHFGDNISFGAGIDGFAVITRQSSDWGAGAQVQAGYKPQGLNVTIFGSADAGISKQDLRIGGFNALSEYVKNLGMSLGVKFSTGTVQFSYSKFEDKMNSTRNRSMFSIGAKINL